VKEDETYRALKQLFRGFPLYLFKCWITVLCFFFGWVVVAVIFGRTPETYHLKTPPFLLGPCSKDDNIVVSGGEPKLPTSSSDVNADKIPKTIKAPNPSEKSLKLRGNL